MYNAKLFLTPQEIYEKEFKLDAQGYRAQEVDHFLDMVNQDYSEFARVIRALENENKQLIEENNKLKAEYRKLKNIIDSANQTGASGISSRGVNNIDLLKRISNLEKVVYGKED